MARTPPLQSPQPPLCYPAPHAAREAPLAVPAVAPLPRVGRRVAHPPRPAAR